MPPRSFVSASFRAAALGAALALASCGDGPTEGLSELEANRARWLALGHTDYLMDQTVVCFCVVERKEVAIEVRAGRVAAVTDKATGVPVDSSSFDYYYTVDRVFDLIREAMTARAGTNVVRYHPTLFYPTDAQLDPILNAIDDEITVKIANLTPRR